MAHGVGVTPEECTGDLELHNVSFAFPGRARDAIRRVSLRVPAGSTLAIVGPSGAGERTRPRRIPPHATPPPSVAPSDTRAALAAGKSTLLKLLLRLFDPDEGAITLDGRDVRELELGWLRRRFGYVPQLPVLFDGTVAENIGARQTSCLLPPLTCTSALPFSAQELTPPPSLPQRSGWRRRRRRGFCEQPPLQPKRRRWWRPCPAGCTRASERAGGRCPVGSGKGLRSPGRWCASQQFCCGTRPRHPSTRGPSVRSRTRSGSWVDSARPSSSPTDCEQALGRTRVLVLHGTPIARASSASPAHLCQHLPS